MFASLDDQRIVVIDALDRAMRRSEASRRKLLGVKGEALATATEVDATIRCSPTRPAIERYSGVLYGELDAASLTSVDRRRLRQLVIFSGLWGAVAPGDPIPDYKLKMGVSLPPIGRLATFWRGPVTAALAPVVDRRVVWDLLPNEHEAAWAPPTAGSRAPDAPTAIISVRFLEEHPRRRGGERRFTTVNHWNKLLKGALVRHVLATGADEPAALERFEHPHGYRYDPRLTDSAVGRTVVSLVRAVR